MLLIARKILLGILGFCFANSWISALIFFRVKFSCEPHKLHGMIGNACSFAKEQAFPIIPCNLCGSQENLTRKKIKALIQELAKQNPKIPSNILRAISNIKPSQLMDHHLWNFRELETGLGARTK